MSGAIIPTPADGADWDDVETQIVKARRGYIGLSLTEFDTAVIPQIAAGSVIEINGVLFTFSSNESITGAASSGYINYIVATVAGSGNSQTVTFGWTTTAPSWVASKHGWYGAGDGNDRYLGRCYFDGTNYTQKMVYSNNLSLSDRNGNEVVSIRKAFITATFSGDPPGVATDSRTIDIVGAGFNPNFVENVYIDADFQATGASGITSTLWSGNNANDGANLVSGILSVAYITDGIRVTYRLSIADAGAVTDMELIAHALVGLSG